MLTMNRATLLGHAGRDPEIRTLPNGGKAASFSLATAERWKGKDGGFVERTEWHRIIVYGPAADIVEKRLRKGTAVLVEGRLASREYRDREGNERTVTEIVVAGPKGAVNLLGGPRDAGRIAGARTDPAPGGSNGAAAGAGA